MANQELINGLNQAPNRYLKMAALADKAGLADLKLKMEEQAADEARHGEYTRRMLAWTMGEIDAFLNERLE